MKTASERVWTIDIVKAKPNYKKFSFEKDLGADSRYDLGLIKLKQMLCIIITYIRVWI